MFTISVGEDSRGLQIYDHRRMYVASSLCGSIEVTGVGFYKWTALLEIRVLQGFFTNTCITSPYHIRFFLNPLSVKSVKNP
jgi:hypothetical protein